MSNLYILVTFSNLNTYDLILKFIVPNSNLCYQSLNLNNNQHYILLNCKSNLMNYYDLKWSTVQFRHGCRRMAESDKNWAKWNNGKDKSLSHSEKWNGLISTDTLHYLFLFKVFSQWKPFLQSLFTFMCLAWGPWVCSMQISDTLKFDQ